MKTIKQIQNEHREWELKNFGEQPIHRAVMGVVEELGEFDEALWDGNQDAQTDALGDACIYLLALCSRLGWDFEEIVWKARRKSSNLSFMTWSGKLCHSQLKLEQGIRGDETKHELDMLHSVRVITWMIEIHCTRLGVTLPGVLAETWEQVSHRDWKKNRQDGGVSC